MSIARITQPKDSYVFDYPEAVKFTDQQMSIYWLPTEIKVEKDIQDLRVNMTEAEAHGVLSVLKLFVKYETLIGNEYWNGRIRQSFPRPEIEMMASTFGFVELGIHARFYNQINEAMLLNTDEFHESYREDPVLAERIDFVNGIADSDNLPLAVGVFSMLEGAVLYSSFAFLKHFQSQGKNKLVNVCRGVNQSAIDETLHAEAGAWLYRTLVAELGLGGADLKELQDGILEAADHIRDHEFAIIEKIFEKGEIEGINKRDLQTFVDSRLNVCLQNLGIDDLYLVEDNPIADWFYTGMNGVQFHDFFTGTGSAYSFTSSDPSNFDW